MNFDKLKDDWNSDNLGVKEINKNMLSLKETRTPIDIIRKKMKGEFYIQTLSLIFLAFIPKILNFPNHALPVFIVFYALYCGFSTYYFYKFFKFYKHSYDMSLDSKKNLLWFYYEMKINVELYKALTYILSFIALSFVISYMIIVKNGILYMILSNLSLVYIMLNCFIGIILIGVITELFAKYNYGNYLNKIKTILDRLDSEEI